MRTSPPRIHALAPIAAVVTAAALTAATAGITGTASASTARPAASSSGLVSDYVGYAYGTNITGLGGIVHSGQTALSALACTVTPGLTRSNATAAVNLPVVGRVGAVTSKVTTAQNSTGPVSTATTTIAGVSLLGGLVDADTLTSVSTATDTSAGFGGTANSTFVNLRIAGVPIHITSPGRRINLPLNAGYVVINNQYTSHNSTATTSFAEALKIVITDPLLLHLPGLTAAGQLDLSSATASLTPNVTGVLAGGAYASQIQVGSTLASGPTALTIAGCTGSNQSNTVLALRLPGAATIGAASTHTVASTSAQLASVRAVAQLSNVNVLSGLLTANVLSGVAQETKTPRGGFVSSVNGTGIAGLSILGRKYTGNIGANTVITVPGIAKITLRKTAAGPNVIQQWLVEISLLSGRGGYAAGAVIDLGYTGAKIVTS